MPSRAVATDPFSTQRQLLWDLCYRVTGTVGDADMLVHDCLAAAAVRPPIHADAWRTRLLHSVATLATDALQNRRRRQYVGSWLPAPVETGSAASPGPRPDGTAGPRYDMVESGTFAFLRALEELGRRERVILVMCDACGLALQEVAAALDFTAATTRTLLHSARRRMDEYAATHVPPTSEVQAHAAECTRECLSHFQRMDSGRLEKTLAPDAQAIFDSGGEFVAPSGSTVGAGAVAKLLTRFAAGTGPISLTYRMVNGMPAAIAQSPGRSRWARRFVVRVEIRDDLVSEVHLVLATAKLTAIRFDPL